MPKVLNKRHYPGVTPWPPGGTVYVGRPSEFGNPFSHLTRSSSQFKVKTIEEAVVKHRDWFLSNDVLVRKVKLLRGKNLMCWCCNKSLEEILDPNNVPACHAEIYLIVANT